MLIFLLKTLSAKSQTPVLPMMSPSRSLARHKCKPASVRHFIDEDIGGGSNEDLTSDFTDEYVSSDFTDADFDFIDEGLLDRHVVENDNTDQGLTTVSPSQPIHALASTCVEFFPPPEPTLPVSQVGQI